MAVCMEYLPQCYAALTQYHKCIIPAFKLHVSQFMHWFSISGAWDGIHTVLVHFLCAVKVVTSRRCFVGALTFRRNLYNVSDGLESRGLGCLQGSQLTIGNIRSRQGNSKSSYSVAPVYTLRAPVFRRSVSTD